jgi:hypothetical protein
LNIDGVIKLQFLGQRCQALPLWRCPIVLNFTEAKHPRLSSFAQVNRPP